MTSQELTVNGQMKFDGFISYSQSSDIEAARALQHGLERFARAWYKRRALRVFLDESSLSASPDIWESIHEKLCHSRWLILIACPEAARSIWVRRELVWWLNNRSSRGIVFLVTAGKMVWDRAEADFDWNQTDALPDLLRGQIPGEPRYVDLRWTRDRNASSVDRIRFQAAILDVAALLRGLDKDDMEGEAVRAQRRNLAWMWMAISVLAAASLAASLGWKEAVKQKNEAVKERNLALSRQLAAQARESTTRSDLRLLLSIAALRVAKTIEAQRSLMDSVWDSSVPFSYLWGAPKVDLKDVEIGIDNRTVRTMTYLGLGQTWELVSKKWVPTKILPMDLRSTTDRSYGFSSRFIFRQSGGSTTVWDAGSGSAIAGPIQSKNRNIVDIAFSADGKYMALATGQAGEVELSSRLNATAPPATLICPKPAYAIAFSPDSSMLAAACDEEIWIWSLSLRTWTTKIRYENPEEGGSTRPQFSFDGSSIATSRGNSALIYEVKTGNLLHRLTAHRDWVKAVAFRPGGKSLATAGLDGSVILWDLSEKNPTFKVLAGHHTGVLGLAWSADGNTLVSTGENGLAIAWDCSGALPAESRIVVMGNAADTPILLTNAGAAFVRSNGQLDFWDARELKLRTVGELPAMADAAPIAIDNSSTSFRLILADGRLATFDTTSHRLVINAGAINKGSFSIDSSGQFLAYAEGDRLHVFDSVSAKELWNVAHRHPRRVDAVEFNHAGNQLASGGDDGVIRLWSVSPTPGPGIELHGPELVRSVSFSPDGKSLAAGYSTGEIIIWDIGSRSAIGEALRGHSGPVLSLAYNLSGDKLASGGGDRAIMIWDVSSHLALSSPLVVHKGTVVALAFSASDPDVLMSQDDSDDILMTHVDIATLSRAACRTANRPITHLEWSQYISDLGEYEPLCTDFQ
jgi:WD40 repeat protein